MARLAKVNWLLGVIVALGLGLRLWGINFGLPYTVAPDEPTHLSIALRMFKNLDPDPHWLNYPSLTFYLNALAYVPYYLIGKVMGVLASPADIPLPEIVTMGVGRSLLPSQFLLGRGLTALFGAASIILVYWIARDLHPARIAALVAAFFFAISPASVYNSHLIRPDTFVVFFVLFSFLWARRILDRPGVSNYVLAGVGAGLAVSSKYNVPLAVMPLIAAHFVRWGTAALRRKEIYLGLAASAVAFFATTPFALLDYQEFFRGMGFEVTAQAAGHAGSEGDTLAWYLSFAWSTEGIITLASLVQAVRLVLARSRDGIVLLSFPVTYFAFINLFIVRNDRTFLPIIPFLDILAALLIVELYEWVRRTDRVRYPLVGGGLVVACALLAFQPLQNAIAADVSLMQIDGREGARAWIEQNLPAGSRIAVEAYSPYVDRQRFAVQGVEAIIDYPLEWYIQNGFEYLVYSYGMYGRFYEDRARYADFAERYDTYFSRWPELKRFDDNGYEIRIYRTAVPGLPSQRVAVRFGIYAGLLEMVGYDLTAARAGEPLKVELYWRALESRREPLTLTARLRDRADREIAHSSGDLFGTLPPDGRWPEGIARVPLTLPAPGEPGIYRIELDVDALDLGRIPVLSFSGEQVSDKLFIAPIKVSPVPPAQSELSAAQPINANFANALALRGYALASSAVRPGGSLTLTLYWQSLGKSDKDYTVFLHLLDASGSLRAQLDTQPRGGAYPTSIWDPGEIVRDDYALALPSDLPPGNYRLEIGLYEYPGLVRLSVTAADGRNLGDRLILDESIQAVP